MHTCYKKINDVVAFAYSNIYNFLVCIFIIFISIHVKGQIVSTAANSIFSLPASNSILTMPTATDVVSINDGLPLQVVLSTSQSNNKNTTAPRLYYNYNNTNIGSATLSLPVFASNTVWTDDVSLAQNGNTVIVYVTCRVFNTTNSSINIFIARSAWNGSSNSFGSFSTTFITSRPINVTENPFDRVSMEAPKNPNFSNTPYTTVDIVWQQSGNIYVRKSNMSFTTGVLGNGANTLLFISNSLQYPGVFSCPDVVRLTNDHRTISVLYKYANTQSILITMDEDLLLPGLGIYNTDVLTVYSIANANKLLRTPRVDMPTKYYYAVCFNEYDISTKKSNIIVVANPQGAVPIVLPVINSELETSCTNNSNYKLTGFPAIKFTTPNDVGNAQGNYVFEVAWQQVAWSGSNFCTINAIAKRFTWNNTTQSITQPAPIGNQFLHINQSLTLNSFFPSIAALPNSCENFYAFGIMDKTTSANGKIGYKKTNCSGNSLRQSPSITIANNKKEKVYIYPNPVHDALVVQLNNVHNQLVHLQFINMQGLIIKEYTQQAINKLTIPVTNLPSGNYVVKIAMGNDPIMIKKILVQHPY